MSGTPSSSSMGLGDRVPKSPHHRIKSMRSQKALVAHPPLATSNIPPAVGAAAVLSPSSASASATAFSEDASPASPLSGGLPHAASSSSLHASIAASIAAAGTFPRSHTPSYVSGRTLDRRRKSSQPELALRSRAHSLVASQAISVHGQPQNSQPPQHLPMSASAATSPAVPNIPHPIPIPASAPVSTATTPATSKPHTPIPTSHPSLPRSLDVRAIAAAAAAAAANSDGRGSPPATSAVSAVSSSKLPLDPIDPAKSARRPGAMRSNSAITSRQPAVASTTTAGAAATNNAGVSNPPASAAPPLVTRPSQTSAQPVPSSNSSVAHLSGMTRNDPAEPTPNLQYTPHPALQTAGDGADVTVAPASGMYYSKAPVSGIPMAAVRAHTTALIGSNVYVFAGCNANTCFNELYVMDADSFYWSKPHVVGAIPIPLRAMTCTAVGKKLVVFGGGDGPAYYNDVYVLDTTNFRWSKPRILGDTIPSKRRAHTACLYKNGLYVFGGGDGVRALNEIWRLDVSDMTKMSWSLVYSPEAFARRDTGPKARGYHTANMFGSKLIIYGGSDGDKCFHDVWVFDVDRCIWKSFNTATVHRRLAHTATLVGSYLFIVGGHDGETYTNEILLLNLVSMTWETRKIYGSLPSGRGYHGAVIYDGRLISIGGFDGAEVFNDVWVLELAVHSYYSQISHFSIDMS